MVTFSYFYAYAKIRRFEIGPTRNMDPGGELVMNLFLYLNDVYTCDNMKRV